ncbi:histidine kinase [Chroococcidiopsis sp. TS-821]|nr:histidine kinase [Chroococcidiopsis sp. TS-821]
MELGVVTVEPERKITQELEQHLKIFSDLGSLETQTIPIFDAATQTAADFLEVPICILGFLNQNTFWFKSAVGLSRLGLRSKIAQERQLSRQEAFVAHVVENQKILAIDDTLNFNPVFANSVLVQQYGIRAYIGAPLVNLSGQCLGAIAIMDLKPRNFTLRDMKFLELMACWSMSELERYQLLKGIHPPDNPCLAAPLESTNTAGMVPTNTQANSSPVATSTHNDERITHAVSTEQENSEYLSTNQVKLELLSQLTQELRTPLTSVLGMASVVSREIYGPLTRKQKEYLEIIENSGRHLLSLVNEISELGTLDSNFAALNLTSVEIEMLCQQVISALSETARRREQQIDLSLEPGRSRTWILDKDKIKQLLYQLIFYITQIAATGSIIHIHVSHKSNGLHFAIWASHPWLEQGLTQAEPALRQILPSFADRVTTADSIQAQSADGDRLPVLATQVLNAAHAMNSADAEVAQKHNPLEGLYHSSNSLRLLLSCDLAKLHGGTINLQGSPESGYRYVVVLPELTAPTTEETI